MPMPARPQFSLLWLLGAVTVCCLIVGGLATDWGDRVGFWLTLLISAGVSTALVVCLVRLASGAGVPSRRQLALSGVAGAFLLFLLWDLEKNGAWWLGWRLPWFWVRDIASAGSMLSLSLWVADITVWRVLRREPDDALPVESRHAARLSLAILGGGAVVSAVLSVTTFFIRGEWRLEPGSLLIVVGAGIVVAIPWVRILRRRAVTDRQFGIAEYVSRNGLVAGSALVMFAIGFASVVWISDWPAAKRWITGEMIWLGGHHLPLWAGSGLILLSVVIELWRDQWHPRLTAVGLVGLSGYWIAVIFIDAIGSVH